MRDFFIMCLPGLIVCAGRIEKGAPVSTNVSSIMESVFQRMALNVIFDDINVESISSYERKRQKQMMFSYQQIQTALVPVMENLMKHASLEQMRDQLQFLVVCEVTCVDHLFTQVNKMDIIYGQGSLLRHFSTWLIISPDDLHPLNVSLDNIAWIHFRNKFSSSYPDVKGVYTLSWMPGRREWSKIDMTDFQTLQSYNNLFPNKDRGLNGRKLVLTTLHWPVFAVRNVVNGKVNYTGVGVDIANSLKTTFNFSYIIVEPEDNLWGNELDNGTFTGVLGMLETKKAHFCPSPYTIEARRMRILDFSSPLGSNEYSLVYRRNSDLFVSWLFLTSSFKWPVYVCGSGSLLLVFLWFFCIYYLRGNDLGQSKRQVWYFDIILQIPFRQDIQISPQSTSSRIMIFTWSLFCLVFAAVYTGDLVAIATIAKENQPFTTLEEFSEQTEYKAFLDEGASVSEMFKGTNNSFLRSIRERSFVLQTSQNQTFEDRVKAFLDQLSSGSFAAMVSYGLDKILMAKTCDMFKTKPFFPRHTGIPFPKHSPLKKLFKARLLALKEMGIIDKRAEEGWPKVKECNPSINRPKVTVDHLKSGLVVTCFGIMVALTVLLIELLRQTVERQTSG